VSRLVKPVEILVRKALLNTIQSSIVLLLLLWKSLLLLVFGKCQFRPSILTTSWRTLFRARKPILR